MKKQDIDKIADEIIRGDNFKLSQRTMDEIRATPKDELVTLHHTLGRAIRNFYNLWSRPWKPKIKDGVDVSPDHPDAISMSVIEKVWEKLQK